VAHFTREPLGSAILSPSTRSQEQRGGCK